MAEEAESSPYPSMRDVKSARVLMMRELGKKIMGSIPCRDYVVLICKNNVCTIYILETIIITG